MWLIKKAVITAGGSRQRLIPLQTLVDRDGVAKSALRIILEEVISAGIRSIAIIVHPGDEASYEEAAGPLEADLTFITQNEPLGYAHALTLAEKFVAGEPFLHLVSDHLYVSSGTKRCAQKLVETASAEECSISAVQPTREWQLKNFGAVSGKLESGRKGLYRVNYVIEKPTPTEAEQKLIAPGLRSGMYLCLFGMHVFSPTMFEILLEDTKSALDKIKASGNTNAALPDLMIPLNRLVQRERYLAYELEESRFNIEEKYGVHHAQTALALAGIDRDEFLTQMTELLALRKLSH